MYVYNTIVDSVNITLIKVKCPIFHKDKNASINDKKII